MYEVCTGCKACKLETYNPKSRYLSTLELSRHLGPKDTLGIRIIRYYPAIIAGLGALFRGHPAQKFVTRLLSRIHSPAGLSPRRVRLSACQRDKVADIHE